MVYLILSIVFNTIIGIVFKLFDRYNVHVFQAIIFNYLTCALMAETLFPGSLLDKENLDLNWFPYSVLLGLVFIIGFNLMGYCVKYYGISLSTLMQRMSLIASSLFAIYYFQESLSAMKIIGILIAIAAIYLANFPFKEKRGIHSNALIIFLPFILWIFTGLVEIILQYVELEILNQSGDPLFIGSTFGWAGIFGFLVFVIGCLMGKMRFTIKGVIAGILLGLPNYFSLHYMMKALGSGIEGSVFYPVTNVAILAISVLAGLFVFHEKISRINLIGVLIALIAILFIGFS